MALLTRGTRTGVAGGQGENYSFVELITQKNAYFISPAPKFPAYLTAVILNDPIIGKEALGL